MTTQTTVQNRMGLALTGFLFGMVSFLVLLLGLALFLVPGSVRGIFLLLALVFALIGLPFAGTGRRTTAGKGLATTGLVLSLITLVVVLSILVLGFSLYQTTIQDWVSTTAKPGIQQAQEQAEQQRATYSVRVRSAAEYVSWMKQHALGDFGLPIADVRLNAQVANQLWIKLANGYSNTQLIAVGKAVATDYRNRMATRRVHVVVADAKMPRVEIVLDNEEFAVTPL